MTTPPTHYHTISIGSGEAGKYICWTLSSTLNLRTAVIEHKYLGGSCPNIACLPSKNFIHSAQITHSARQNVGTGLLKLAKGGTGEVQVDMQAVRGRKREMVDGLLDMHRGVFEKSGAELVLGHARLVAVVGSRKVVELDPQDGSASKLLSADNVILCLGSRAKFDSGIEGLEAARPLTHIEILELDCVPRHLVILGGGYVGMEFAQAFRRFGSKVSVVEKGERILKAEDEDVSEALVEIMKDEGVEFFTDTQVHAVKGVSGKDVTLSASIKGQAVEINGSHLLVASGRLPNTKDTGLENVGVKLTPTGHVKVDEYLQTDIPGVFAVGDCAGSPHFTHIGFDDFRIVRDLLLNKGSQRSTKGRQVPYTLYTDPELAHVGLSERVAKTAGIQYRLSKLPMAAFLRTRTMGATRGFAKALVSATDDTILGFTALGPRAGEMLPVVQLAMTSGLPYTSIADLIVTHPTMNEGLVSLFGSVPPRAA
ncbi:Dihydrolipoyl dehydrogenase [Curvularia clavata]|uniref:Dihydrolipoyl dehydrogenase n=1 Tax=Curvularia clavata TaxID=95742 RepID=A0A9Q8ZBB6_CURCL|nr:Dihydrolipoyl dehydrogenase [Curvularia clavata]